MFDHENLELQLCEGNIIMYMSKILMYTVWHCLHGNDYMCGIVAHGNSCMFNLSNIGCIAADACLVLYAWQ